MNRTDEEPAGERAKRGPAAGGASAKRRAKLPSAKRPGKQVGGEGAASTPSASQGPPRQDSESIPTPPLRGGVPVDLTACQERIGYQFRDDSILHAALTHASGAAHRLASNERLEFLGDAILGFIVCDTLYRIFPESLEGDLTRIKSVVVSRETCGRISEQLGLTDFLIVGKGLAVNSAVPVSVLSDLFESVVAAIYLDGGIEPARKFVSRWMEPEIAQVSSGAQGANHKSLLQQLSQRDFGVTPTYEVMEESGPDHSKSFHVSAFIGERRYTPAWGRNKKEAEQRAASNALVELRTTAPGVDDQDHRG